MKRKWCVTAEFHQLVAHKANQRASVEAGNWKQAIRAGVRELAKSRDLKGRRIKTVILKVFREDA